MRKLTNIKAIMCDVDGTLLNHEGIVSPATVATIKKLEKKEFYLVYQQDVMFTALKHF